jgi:ubiquitin carboxyl-terminal hydrolase 25/28
VYQLRLLFLQLYKTDAAAVRPDEELAYLAITRPEFDSVIEAVEEPGSLLDSLPDVGSPSSTMVNTPVNSRPTSPLLRSPSISRSSVLGKRVSQDRESASPGERPKKSDGFEKLAEVDDVEHDFEMVDNTEEEKPKPVHHEFAEDLPSISTDIPSSAPSTTADMDIDGLKLKSPELESQDRIDRETFAPPAGPPPLPPRPRRASKGTLNAGLKFGESLDKA